MFEKLFHREIISIMMTFLLIGAVLFPNDSSAMQKKPLVAEPEVISEYGIDISKHTDRAYDKE